jgi:hypothetical protein
VRCPKELAHIVQRAGGVWEPGSRRWLVERPVDPRAWRLWKIPWASGIHYYIIELVREMQVDQAAFIPPVPVPVPAG